MYELWLSMLFEISIELEGHLNSFNTETINLLYSVGKQKKNIPIKYLTRQYITERSTVRR